MWRGEDAFKELSRNDPLRKGKMRGELRTYVLSDYGRSADAQLFMGRIARASRRGGSQDRIQQAYLRAARRQRALKGWLRWARDRVSSLARQVLDKDLGSVRAGPATPKGVPFVAHQP